MIWGSEKKQYGQEKKKIIRIPCPRNSIEKSEMPGIERDSWNSLRKGTHTPPNKVK